MTKYINVQDYANGGGTSYRADNFGLWVCRRIMQCDPDTRGDGQKLNVTAKPKYKTVRSVRKLIEVITR